MCKSALNSPMEWILHYIKKLTFTFTVVQLPGSLSRRCVVVVDMKCTRHQDPTFQFPTTQNIRGMNEHIWKKVFYVMSLYIRVNGSHTIL